MANYADVYNDWKSDPGAFWMEAAKEIDWVSAPTTAFDGDAGVYGRWFPDGVCNTAYNCLDRHVEAVRRGYGR